MKNILFIVLLFTITQTYSQVDKEKNMKANIESLKVDVNSLEELKEINWKEIEDAFKENDPERGPRAWRACAGPGRDVQGRRFRYAQFESFRPYSRIARVRDRGIAA